MNKNYDKYLIDKILEDYSSVDSKNIYTIKWDDFKELVLVDKVKESIDISSFYFKSTDNSKLIKHKAGQYLPLKIKTTDEKYKDELRTYSLSMIPNESIYRISVKKIKNGLISTYLHDNLKIGDKIEAMVPSGVFILSKNSSKPLILISGGIGITPLLSMIYDLSMNNKVNRDIYFIQAVQNSLNHPFKDDLNKISNMINMKNYVFYSNPLKEDDVNKSYDCKGYINKDWIQNNLPLNGDFYFCGPPIFMKSLKTSLLALGVDISSINYEFFGEPSDI